jgi:Xaa-Pro aminopeptidase
MPATGCLEFDMKDSKDLLIFAASDYDANMLYAVGFFVPDPFIYLRLRGREYIVMSDLEIDRARRQAAHCRALSLSQCQRRLRDQGVKQPAHAQVIHAILREKKVRQVAVPGNFPLQVARELEELGISVTPKPGTFFPEREQKSAAETKKIVDALRLTEASMAEAIRVLRASKVARNRRLSYQGTPLTSERLRGFIGTVITQGGGLAAHTIVAGGNQACEPHESGYGPLSANEPIILDIFPRLQKTGYFGDLTRTVVKGKASAAVQKLYATVFQAQKIAFERMRPGVPTADVHRAVQEYFEGQGYQTGKHNGRMQGFFHGTGHGLGLEIHEAPRTGPNSPGTLKTGHVVTVEPGLYYPGVGGVRLEDVALVTDGRPRNLTRIEKALEI